MKKLILRMAFAITIGAFLSAGMAYAENIEKPLGDWAQTQVTVYNSDFDNIVHVDITYDLDALWAGIVADGTVDVGEYQSRERMHEVTYFWICVYSINSSEYVDGTEGEGNQFIGDYYWGLFAHDPEVPLHCSLSVPGSYGTGLYRVEVKTRLGTWDYSYYAPWLQSPQFQVDRFATSLPVPSGSIDNPDGDPIIKVTIPAYSAFPGYDPSLPPSKYMIEISADDQFPWQQNVFYNYIDAQNTTMTLYYNIDSLDHGDSLFYGRIRSLGPDGEWWTASDTASLGTVTVTSWDIVIVPVADFTSDVTTGDEPFTVNFADASTGTVTSWSWDFGDTGTDTVQNPSHTYNAVGTYTVTLTATGPGGSDGETKTDYITVTEPVPVLDFTASPTSGAYPLEVSFTSLSTGDITRYCWEFGDNESASGRDLGVISHIYTTAGTYTVTLTVTEPAGSYDKTREDYISVSP